MTVDDAAPLERMRAELDDLEPLALSEHVARYERINDLLTQELAKLDEV